MEEIAPTETIAPMPASAARCSTPSRSASSLRSARWQCVSMMGFIRAGAAISFRTALGVRIRTEAGGGYRMQMQDQARRLLWHGVFLFLLGLITGLAIPIINNHRMALSAHLEALLNGILLLALGCLWPQLRLSERAAGAAFWLALYGT